MFWSHDIVFCVCATYFLWTRSYLIGRETVCFEKHNIYRHDTSITKHWSYGAGWYNFFFEKNFAWNIYTYMIDNFQNLQLIINEITNIIWDAEHLYISPLPPLRRYLPTYLDRFSFGLVKAIVLRGSKQRTLHITFFVRRLSVRMTSSSLKLVKLWLTLLFIMMNEEVMKRIRHIDSTHLITMNQEMNNR